MSAPSQPCRRPPVHVYPADETLEDIEAASGVHWTGPVTDLIQWCRANQLPNYVRELVPLIENLQVPPNVVDESYALGSITYVLAGMTNEPPKFLTKRQRKELESLIEVAMPLIHDRQRRLESAREKEDKAMAQIARRLSTFRRDARRRIKPTNRTPINGSANGMSANVVRDPKLEARDKWIYKSVCNVAMQLGEIKGNLRIKIGSQKPGKRWSMITSVQGIRRAANKYAERNHLDAPPSRKNK